MDERKKQEIKQIIQEDKPELLVKFAEREGTSMANNGLTTSQIRGFFGQVRQIEAIWRIKDQRGQAERAFALLKPRLAYQKAREKKTADLSEMLSFAIDAAFEAVGRGTSELDIRFQRFVELFEAILAYHKAAGGHE